MFAQLAQGFCVTPPMLKFDQAWLGLATTEQTTSIGFLHPEHENFLLLEAHVKISNW
jgi:hypothetical protein